MPRKDPTLTTMDFYVCMNCDTRFAIDNFDAELEDKDVRVCPVCETNDCFKWVSTTTFRR